MSDAEINFSLDQQATIYYVYTQYLDVERLANIVANKRRHEPEVHDRAVSLASESLLVARSIGQLADIGDFSFAKQWARQRLDPEGWERKVQNALYGNSDLENGDSYEADLMESDSEPELPPGQHEVYLLIQHGFSTSEIQELLGIDREKVAYYRKEISRKLGPLESYIAIKVRLAKEKGISPRENIQRLEGLSNREKEVCTLLLEGYSNREIGQELFISEEGAKSHATNIYRALNAAGRNGLINILAEWTPNLPPEELTRILEVFSTIKQRSEQNVAKKSTKNQEKSVGTDADKPELTKTQTSPASKEKRLIGNDNYLERQTPKEEWERVFIREMNRTIYRLELAGFNVTDDTRIPIKQGEVLDTMLEQGLVKKDHASKSGLDFEQTVFALLLGQPAALWLLDPKTKERAKEHVHIGVELRKRNKQEK